jgi:hypothetical protein
LSVSLNRFISRGTSEISKCQIVTKWWVCCSIGDYGVWKYSGGFVCHLSLLKQKIMNSWNGLDKFIEIQSSYIILLVLKLNFPLPHA